MIARVNDAFEIKGATAVRYGATGLVICLRSETGEMVNPTIGDTVLVHRHDGWMIQKRVADTRVTGFFVHGLRREDVPLGSVVMWGSDISRAVDIAGNPMLVASVASA